MKWHWFALLALMSLWFQAPAIAEQKQKGGPGIVGQDDRKVIANRMPPWSAIGQVNIAGHNGQWLCSGTLVAPRVVLTAAHCVVNFETRKLHSLRDISFSAGVRKGRTLGSARARCVKLRKDTVGFDYIAAMGEEASAEHPTPLEIVHDLAVIVLDKDLAKAGTIGIATNQHLIQAGPLAHASYPGSRRNVLSGQENCRALASTIGLLVTDCDIERGSSGGPILVKEEGQYRIAGVAVAFGEHVGTLAVPATSIPPEFLTAECPK